MNETRYLISDASRKLNVEAHVLRYWEEELGLSIPRTEMGHRCYTKELLEQFQQIKTLRSANFQLKTIRMLLPKLSSISESEFALLTLLSDEMNRKAAQLDPDPFYRAPTYTEKWPQPESTAALSFSDEAKEEVCDSPKPENLPAPDPQEAIRSASVSAKPSFFASSTESSPDAKTSHNISRHVAHAASDSHLEDAPALHLLEAAAADSTQKEPAAKTAPEAAAARAQTNAPADSKHSKAPASPEAPANLISLNPTDPASLSEQEKEQKMAQFEAVMTEIVSRALKASSASMSTQISNQLSDHLLREIEYLLHLKEQEEEMRFERLDETIRKHQKHYREAAAAKAPGRIR